MKPINFNIIREDILNQVEELTSFMFASGETRTLALQILNKYSEKPQGVRSGWKVLLQFPTRDQELFREGSVNDCDDDNSIVTVKLSPEETKDIISSWLWVMVVDTNNITSLQQNILFTNYDSSTGVLSLDDMADLENVEEGDIIFNDGEAYLILEFNNELGDKWVRLEKDLAISGSEVGLAKTQTKLIAIKQRILTKERARAC